MMMSNLPSTPGALLGYRRDGRPFYLIAGGSGEDEGAENNDDQNDGHAAGEREDDDRPEKRDDRDEDGERDSREPGGERGEQDRSRPDRDDRDDGKAARTIAAIRGELRDEKDKRRAAQKAATDAQSKVAEFEKTLNDLKADHQSRNDAIAKALGLKEDDAPPDPAKLAEQVATAQAEAEKARTDAQAEITARDERIKAMAVEKAVLLHADKLGGDAQALLDSVSFGVRVKDFDPDGDDFTDKLKAAIKAAVEDDPRLKKPEPKPKRSGGEFNGSPRGRQRPKSLSEAVRGAYGGGS